MNYFLSSDDLEKILKEEREFLFTAIGKALHELEHKFLILFDIGVIKSDPRKIRKGVKHMSEIKDLMEALKTISESKDDDELQDIILRLETALEKDAEKWDNFKGELDNLKGRIKVLEGAPD